MSTVTENRVDVADGKYTVILRSDGKHEALRHGEPWPAYEGGLHSNLIISLAQELFEARDRIDDLVHDLVEGGPT